MNIFEQNVRRMRDSINREADQAIVMALRGKLGEFSMSEIHSRVHVVRYGNRGSTSFYLDDVEFLRLGNIEFDTREEGGSLLLGYTRSVQFC